LKEARVAFERDYLAAQVGRFSGNISRTAEFVGMERSALHRKLKSLGLTEKKPSEEAAVQDG
jgi:two-component system nitrogen regulation response regulator NtrX